MSTTTRDEASRAGAYLTSDKPLFQARHIQRSYFTKPHAPGEENEPNISPTASSSSRLPRRTNLAKPTVSLKGAWERATKEEEDLVVGDGGSPSPAPRPRPPISRSLDEKRGNDRSMRRLREGIGGSMDTLVGRNSADSQPVDDGDTTIGSIGSGSGISISGSEMSVRSSTEDDLDKRITRHKRDQERAATALRNQSGLFTRGGMGTRVTETARTLVRKSSGGSLDKEPPATSSNTWGTRARSNRNWLSRHMSPDSSGELPTIPRPVSSEGIGEWDAAADGIPLPSVEEDLLIQEPTPPQSRPSSAQPLSTSPQKSQIWDVEQDFTANSVQMSTTPQLKVRNSRLDQIKAREIELLSKRAVATHRLEEIKERNSEERTLPPEAVRTIIKEPPIEPRLQETEGLTSNAKFNTVSDVSKAIVAEQSTEVTSAEEMRTEIMEPTEDTKATSETGFAQSVVTPQPRNHLPADKKTIKIDEPPRDFLIDTPAPHDYAYEKRSFGAGEEETPNTPLVISEGVVENEKALRQKEHKRDDPWDTLRRLARVSATPSPAHASQAEELLDEPQEQVDEHSVDFKRLSGTSTPPKSDIDPEERIVAEAQLFDLPDIKSNRNSLRTPSPEEDEHVDETPRPKADPLSKPTPVVMGAYIDTPAPRGRQLKITKPELVVSDVDSALHDEVSRLAIRDFVRGSKPRSTSSRKGRDPAKVHPSPLASNPVSRSPHNAPRPRSRPPLINTAHPASVEDDLRLIQAEGATDDSTLDDFEFLLENDAEVDSLFPNTKAESIKDPSSPLDLESVNQRYPLSEKERQHRAETQSYERLSKTLNSGLMNIRSAKRGIERLAETVSASSIPHSHNHTDGVCAICSSSSTHGVYHLTLPLPRLWSHDSKRRSGIHLTWLGLLLVSLISWLVAETVACDFICHPIYATTNDWSIDDPFWGGAIPTLINRLSGGWLGFTLKWIWRFIVWTCGDWFVGVWHAVSGVGVRNVLKPPNVGDGVAAAARWWWEGDGAASMFEDEAI